MGTNTERASDEISEFEFERPCDTPLKCDLPATYAVWCDHHYLGCPHEGYRCDFHLNGLILETRRDLSFLKTGRKMGCAKCGEIVTGELLSDHLRWVKL